MGYADDLQLYDNTLEAEDTSYVENIVMHCRRGCMDGIQPSPAQPYEDRTHPTGFITSTCEHHVRVGQVRDLGVYIDRITSTKLFN